MSPIYNKTYTSQRFQDTKKSLIFSSRYEKKAKRFTSSSTISNWKFKRMIRVGEVSETYFYWLFQTKKITAIKPVTFKLRSLLRHLQN